MEKPEWDSGRLHVFRNHAPSGLDGSNPSSGSMIKIRVYDRYESFIQRNAPSGVHITGKSSLWDEREVTEEELLKLVRQGEKIIVNP